MSTSGVDSQKLCAPFVYIFGGFLSSELMNTVKVLNATRSSRLSSIRHVSWIKSIFSVEKNTPPWTHCVQVGDPVLRETASEVPSELITSPEIKFLVSQMKSVMKDYKLVGLAAPQIGISLRLFIMSFGENLKENFKPEVYKAKEMSTFPLTVFVNPEIKVLDHNKVIFEEGCASVIGFVAEVPRNYSVQVTATDIDGNKIEHIFKGWNARIAQHETDHLNGILFTDLMNRKTLRCTNWEMINRKLGRIEVPYYPK